MLQKKEKNLQFNKSLIINNILGHLLLFNILQIFNIQRQNLQKSVRLKNQK